MPESLDQLIAPPENPSSTMGPALGGLARQMAPNISSLAMGEPARPPAPLADKPGKTPSSDDPRAIGALAEGVQGGLAGLSMAAPGGAALGAGKALGGAASRLGASETRGLASLLGIGAGAASSNSAEAGEVNLTRKQQRELKAKEEELKIQRAVKTLEAEDAAKRAEKANQEALAFEKQKLTAAAEAKRQEAQWAAEMSLKAKKDEQELVRKHEVEMENRPFRSKFPELATAMSNAGLAVSALLPYGTRLRQAGPSRHFFQAWESIADKTEEAIARGDMPRARMLIDQLSGFKKQEKLFEKVKEPSNVGLYAASAAAPIEFSMLPEQIDLATGSKEAKEHALEQFLDPVRIPASALQGAVATGISAKAPLVGRNKLPPLAKTEGVAKTYKDLAQAQSKARNKVTPTGQSQAVETKKKPRKTAAEDSDEK